MAQKICIPELQKSKHEKLYLNLHLGMVQLSHLDKEGQCGGNCMENECAVDGYGVCLKKASERHVYIQSLNHTTLRPETIKPTRRAACISQSTSEITINYYKSNIIEDLRRGVPVVLNIGGSNQFLKCEFIHGKAVLSVECGDKDKLESIYKNDPDTWPFVFYLSRTKDNCCRFESAECSGWFIHTESEHVSMDKKDKNSEQSSFYIFPSPNSAKSK